MVTKCLACALNPDTECQECGSKYLNVTLHDCVTAIRHVQRTCTTCMCDRCEGIFQVADESFV